MIDQSTIQRIFDASRIEEVVGDYVSLKKRGVNFIGHCPFHTEKTPSFTVSPAKGICKCFGCGKGGNSVNFVMEVEQMNYFEALKHLAKKYGIAIEEREYTPAEKQHQNDRDSMMVVNEFAHKYFTTQLTQTPAGKAIGLGYFYERGFSEMIIEKFNLGYSPDDRDAFTREAVKCGYKIEYLEKTGLSIVNENYQADRFRGRVMFPIHNLSGRVIAFGGRVLKKDEKTAKYLNSPESEIYHKSQIVYGIFHAKQAIVKQDNCFLVEGYTDVISMHQAGIENVVASSGTALTPEQIRLIKRFTNNITVIYDGDAAGIKASLRGIDLILEQALNVKVLLLPDGEDPDSFAKKQSATQFMQYIEDNRTDFINFKTKLLLKDAQKDPIKKASLISDIVKSIAIIPDQIIRSIYIKESSTILNIDERVLYNEMTRMRTSDHDLELKRQNLTPTAAQNNAPLPHFEASPKATTDKDEWLIIKYLICHGEKKFYNEEDAEYAEHKDLTVSMFIISDFETDGFTFKDERFQQVFDEYKRNGKPGFDPHTFFLNHPSPEMSKLAAEMLYEPHELSKIHSESASYETEESNLKHIVPKTLLEYKFQIVQAMRSQANEQLKTATPENMMQILEQIRELDKVKKHLSHLQGRIITPKTRR